MVTQPMCATAARGRCNFAASERGRQENSQRGCRHGYSVHSGAHIRTHAPRPASLAHSGRSESKFCTGDQLTVAQHCHDKHTNTDMPLTCGDCPKVCCSVIIPVSASSGSSSLKWHAAATGRILRDRLLGVAGAEYPTHAVRLRTWSHTRVLCNREGVTNTYPAL